MTLRVKSLHEIKFQKRLDKSQNDVIINIVANTCGSSSVVEHNLAKVGVASSSLVFRSKESRSDGGIGRHAGLKIL